MKYGRSIERLNGSLPAEEIISNQFDDLYINSILTQIYMINKIINWKIDANKSKGFKVADVL